MCKISSLFEIANMDFLVGKICPKMLFLGLGPTLAAPNSTTEASTGMKLVTTFFNHQSKQIYFTA